MAAKFGATSDGKYLIHCPGCGHGHLFDSRWTRAGTPEAPTFRPSHLQTGAKGRCHLFLTDGKLEFLSDCEHELAGQTVALEDFYETDGAEED